MYVVRSTCVLISPFLPFSSLSFSQLPSLLPFFTMTVILYMYCLFPSQSCTGVHGSDHGGRGLGARGKATKRTPATSRTVSGTLSHCTSTQYIHASIVARQTGMFMHSTCTYTLHTYMYMNKSRPTGCEQPLGLDVKQSPHVYMTVHCSCELGHRDKAKQLHLGDGYFCT